ncbi:MAG: SBBP repeat-containing protein [Bacteroidetes bacterium]|nr:SBBP repeat-containing protein [Bacteroidota bacterium]
MKKISKIIFLALTGISLHIQLESLNCAAQTPNWEWVKTSGEYDDDYGASVVTDAKGNVYAAGYYRGFNGITFGTITLTNAGLGDIFLVKYDSHGNALWAKSIGGTSEEHVKNIAIDGNGNVYVAGNFSSQSLPFGNTTLTNAGNFDAFIAKYDANGNPLWAKSAGGSAGEGAYGIAADKSGNVYLAGDYNGTSITFGNFTLTNSNSAGGTFDIFTVKYDGDGNVLWAKNIGGTQNDDCMSIATDTNGNIYMTGYFLGSSTFGSFTLNSRKGTTVDIFTAKYDPNGNVLWAKSAGGRAFEYGRSLTADNSGNVYVTGEYWSNYLIDSTIITNLGGYDIFILKYNSIGNLVWSKNFGGTGDDYGKSITLDGKGYLYLTGYYKGTSMAFDSIQLTNLTGYSDIIVVKCDTSGNALWAKSAGGAGDEKGTGIAADTSGGVYITGDFWSSTIFFDSTPFSTNGNDDFFMAKISFSTTDIVEWHGDDNLIQVYPNPFHSAATIKTNTELKGAELKVYTLMGQEVMRFSITDSQPVTIQRGILINGIYLYQIKNEKQIIGTGKLIIE